MTAGVLTCGRAGCGKHLAIPARGPKPTYCSDRCRQAARRSPATEATVAVPQPTSDRGFAQRPSRDVDYGDGDPCPQDASHGAMYFVNQPKTRQWCPHSGHRGNATYQRDGVTPASRSALDPAAPITGGDQGPSEAPELGGAGVSPTTAHQPSPALPGADHDGSGQLPLALGAAP